MLTTQLMRYVPMAHMYTVEAGFRLAHIRQSRPDSAPALTALTHKDSQGRGQTKEGDEADDAVDEVRPCHI